MYIYNSFIIMTANSSQSSPNPKSGLLLLSEDHSCHQKINIICFCLYKRPIFFQVLQIMLIELLVKINRNEGQYITLHCSWNTYCVACTKENDCLAYKYNGNWMHVQNTKSQTGENCGSARRSESSPCS